MYINGEYVKGTIYFDTSFKDMFWGRVRNHQEYRADVTYNDRRIRFRSKNYEDCVNFLLGLKEDHIAEYMKTCEWCGAVFEAQQPGTRYCSPICRSRKDAQNKRKSYGFSEFDPAAMSESTAHRFYGMGRDKTKRPKPKEPEKPINKKTLVSKGKLRKLRRKGINIKSLGLENDGINKESDSKSG